ncbi:hypothetical protein DFH08DRAFT_906581 [Mycena albidolilacea]|uniref:Uncharacterized protein n=1 Tax=Mycena albidolilacea TaxID=1033008 RepID=A0AAD6YZ01_9AGAR|nr:hypothetical protein DFH08DRAFT_906581 [Mycena albidolilacea]
MPGDRATAARPRATVAARATARTVPTSKGTTTISSPRMNVAQAFDNMTFRSPNWGTERLPLPRSPRAASPSLSHMPQQQQQQKPQSPSDSGPSSQFGPPTINAPEGDALGAGPRGCGGRDRHAGVPGDVTSSHRGA